MNYYLGGINGVGKSTFLQELAKQEPDVKIYHGSKLLMAGLGIVPDDYDTLRQVPSKNKDIAYGAVVIKQLGEHRDAGEIVVFDSHYLGLIEGKVVKATGNWLKKFDCLLLLEAPTDEVLGRVLRDEVARDRKLFPAGMEIAGKRKLLGDYADWTKKEFLSLAQEYGLGSHILLNQNNEIESSVKKFIELHNLLVSKQQC